MAHRTPALIKININMVCVNMLEVGHLIDTGFLNAALVSHYLDHVVGWHR